MYMFIKEWYFFMWMEVHGTHMYTCNHNYHINIMTYVHVTYVHVTYIHVTYVHMTYVHVHVHVHVHVMINAKL